MSFQFSVFGFWFSVFCFFCFFLILFWFFSFFFVFCFFFKKKKKQAFPEGEVQAAVVDGGCDDPEVPVELEQCRTPLDGGVPAGGPAGLRDMR